MKRAAKLKYVMAGMILCFVMTVLCPCPLYAVTPESPENWDAGTTEGWTGLDPLNDSSKSVSNPSNRLEIVFDSEEMPTPEVYIVKADVSASSGDFVGNYWFSAVTNVNFQIHCDTYVPANLKLCFYSEKTGNQWYYDLDAPATGTWTEYNVPMDYESGWWFGSGGTENKFKNDRKNVTWIGLRLQRNSSTDEQTYGFDSFVLNAESDSEDDDGDGLSNWHEYLAGTDPGNPFDKLEMLVGNSTNVNGMLNGYVIRWRSKGNNTYTIQRASDFDEGFFPLATELPATPPINEYIDTTISPDQPYYYKVKVDE